jgi:hypothetical protein
MTDDSAALLADVLSIGRDATRRVFVLADGARFDDLPGALAASGLSHRSLYLNVQDAELVRAGPWLIDPYRQFDPVQNAWGGLPPKSGAEGEAAIAADTEAALREPQASGSFSGSGLAADPERQLETLIQLTGDAPATVFWIGDATLSEPALWRHLRTLNMVLIPKEYDRGPDEPLSESRTAGIAETHEAFMFRHGDGNVLAEVMPVLDAAQFSRVFGPAKALIFPAPDHPRSDGSSLRSAVLPDDAPPARPGLLKLSMAQMEEIENIRLAGSRRETLTYLREHAAEETAHMSDAQLYQEVVKIETRGIALGLTGMTAFLLFSLMCIGGGADAFDDEEFMEAAAESGQHPDEALEAVFDGMIGAADADIEGHA